MVSISIIVFRIYLRYPKDSLETNLPSAFPKKKSYTNVIFSKFLILFFIINKQNNFDT